MTDRTATRLRVRELNRGQRAAARLRLLAVLALTTTPLAAQNNGLPSQSQSAVLIEVIATRGEQCSLLRPWQAASLRMQLRDLMSRFDDTTQTQIRAASAARVEAMTCDDAMLVQWTEAAVPNMEREYLPELLAAYRALATMPVRPTPFDSVTGRANYTDIIPRLDAKLAELVAAGVRLPGDMTLDSLHLRQAGFAAQVAAAIDGTGEAGRFSADQARQIVVDVGHVGELWLRRET